MGELEALPAQVAELQQTVANLTPRPCGPAVPQWSFEDLERAARDD